MKKERISEGGQFLKLFQDVKKYCNGKPSRIAGCWKDSLPFQETVRELRHFTSLIESANANSPQKYTSPVDNSFPAAWEDYQKRWKSEITLAGFDTEWLDSLLQEIGLTKVKETKKAQEDIFEKPDYEHEQEFDPRHHNPAQLFDNALLILDDNLQAMEGMWDESHGNTIRMAFGAWDYLQKTIGIDIYGISKRWKLTPFFLVPQSVAKNHGNDLYDLLQSAYKAYVFGLFLPSIAMCRAVLEEILKKRYPKNWKNEKGEDKPLMTIVKELKHQEKRFEKIKMWSGLKEMIDHANSVLHPENKNKTENNEEISFDFLILLKVLIEDTAHISSHAGCPPARA